MPAIFTSSPPLHLRVIVSLLGLFLLPACDAPPPRYQEAGLREVLVRPRADLAGWGEVRWGQNRLAFHKAVYRQYLADAVREDTRDPRNVVRVGGFDYYIEPRFEPDLIALHFESLLHRADELRAFAPVVLQDFRAVYGEPDGEWSFTQEQARLDYYEWRRNGTTITLEVTQQKQGPGSLRFRMQRQAGYRDVVRVAAGEWRETPLLIRDWFGLPVMLVRRTDVTQSAIRLNHADTPEDAPRYRSRASLRLADAHPLMRNAELDPVWRSLRTELGVFIAADPLDGCALAYFYMPHNSVHLPEYVRRSGLQTGFYSSCAGRVFDLAGRPVGSKPGPAMQLLVPAHHYAADGDLVLGVR